VHRSPELAICALNDQIAEFVEFLFFGKHESIETKEATIEFKAKSLIYSYGYIVFTIVRRRIIESCLTNLGKWHCDSISRKDRGFAEYDASISDY